MFQCSRPHPTPHYAEVVYRCPRKRAGSPAMQLFQLLGHTVLDVANVAETLSF
jgi:hypothetical protein